MRFAMENDARAAKAAGELKAILSGYGVRRTLKSCRETVAGMYGYAGWGDMLSSLGQGRDPDDADVDQGERDLRREVQVAALARSGLSDAMAEAAAASLSLTARGGRDLARATVVPVERSFCYHPYRFREDVEALERTRLDMQTRDMGWDIYRDDGFETLARITRDFMTTRGAVPLDLEGIDADRYFNLHETAQEVFEGPCAIVDASMMVREGSTASVLDEGYRDVLGGAGIGYVHLGENAYPSPFPGCGIEGCYVRVPATSEDGAVVQAVFVVSPEMPPGIDAYDAEEDRTPWQGVMYGARHVVCTATFAPETGMRLGRLVEDEDSFEPGSFATWSPYLAAPFSAAWRALGADRLGLGVVDGIAVDLDDSLRRRLARARTPGQREKVVSDIAEEGEALIRFVGGIPETATCPGDLLSGPAMFPDPPVGDPLAWADAYARIGVEAHLPAARIMFGERAIRFLGSVDGTPPDSPGRRILSFALAIRSDGLAETGALDEAVDCLRDALERGGRFDASRLRARLVALHVMRGDEKSAREACGLAREDIFGDANPEWAEALVEARFSAPDVARKAVAAAARDTPGVVGLLRDRYPQDGFRWIPAQTLGEFDLLDAGLLHDAWRTVTGYDAILSDGLAMAQSPVEDEEEADMADVVGAWRDLLPTEEERDRAGRSQSDFRDAFVKSADVPGQGESPVWQGGGETKGMAWKAVLRDHGGALFLRVETDRDGEPSVDVLKVRTAPPGDLIGEWHFTRSMNGYESWSEFRGPIKLLLRKTPSYSIDYGDGREKRKRDIPRDVLSEVCDRLMADRLPDLSAHLGSSHRDRMAVIVCRWADAHDAVGTTAAAVEGLDADMVATAALLPERDRRRLAGSTLAEQAVVPVHFRETGLGVLKMRVSDKGGHILVEPTDRATKVRAQGRLLDDGETWTHIGRDGTVTNARYEGCSHERGDAYLREAVRSYVMAYPHAFDRARLAGLAARRMDAAKGADKAVETERSERGWLRQAGERHEAVIAFLAGVGVTMPACPGLPDPERFAAPEVEEDAAMAPLW